MIPDFSRRDWQESRRDAQLRISILDGKGKEMPSFRGKIDRDLALALVGYVRTLGPSRAKAVTPGLESFHNELEELQNEFESLRNEARKLSNDLPPGSAAQKKAAERSLRPN